MIQKLKYSLFAVLAIAMCFATAKPAQAALVGHWTFDGNVLDSSGNTNDGTLSGGLTALNYNADVPAFLAGAGSQSLSFAGGTNHVLVPHDASLDISSSITIAAWVKPIGPVAWDGILAKSPSVGSASAQPGNYELRVENGSRALTFHHQQGGVDDIASTSSSGVVASGVWQHVAVTATNGGNASYYINGQSAGISALTGLFGATNTSSLYIGSRADLFTTMDGLIDDVRIYDTELTGQQVADLSGNVFIPPPPPVAPHPTILGMTATATSEFSGRTAANTVNLSGLTINSHNTDFSNMWLTSGGASPIGQSITVDLHGVYNVEDLRIWNYNEVANAVCCLSRSINQAKIFVAGADGVFGATPFLTTNLAQAPGTDTDFSEVVSLSGAQARFVKIEVGSTYGDPTFTGLSEIKITGTLVPAVVDPQQIPATVSAVSSELVGFDRLKEYVTDGSGLIGDAHTILPDANMWLNQGTFPGGTADLDPEIVFDLGTVQTVDRMKVWNYNEENVAAPDIFRKRGIATADILVSDDGITFSPHILNQSFAIAPGSDVVDFGEVIDLLGVSARFIKFDITSNHDGDNNFVGLSEVQFFVPEPSSFCLLALGLVGLFIARYRR